MGDPSAPAVHKALRATFLFASLDDDEVSALADEVWLEQIPSGSVIVREGDDADALYVVVDGGVNVTKADGQFLAYLGPGGFFGEMALFLSGSKRSATCVSNADTTCVIVREPVLTRFCSERPAAGLKIYRAIIRTLAERLQSTSADLAYLMGAQVKRQAAVDALVSSAKATKDSR
jgi:CRP-like cAMP-binding protein